MVQLSRPDLVPKVAIFAILRFFFKKKATNGRYLRNQDELGLHIGRK